MIQVSVKKFAKYLASVSAVLCVGLWVAGCTPKEEKKDDPLNVSGGELTKGGGSGYANAAVTSDNLDDFIDVFRSALDSYYGDGGYYSGGAQRGKRALPAEYVKEKDGWKGNYKVYGESSGYAEIAGEESEEWQETSASETGTGTSSATYKFFDFSNTNKLFLGGAVGYVEKWEYKNDTTTVTKKYNGSINFKGAFEGKVVFDNISNVLKYRYIEDHDHDEDGNCMHDTISTDRKGNFYVESNGKQIKLPISSLWRFISPRSDKDEDFGNDKITLARPAVPAAPNGTLNNHTGNNAAVSADKVSAFFEAFNAEFSAGKYWRNNSPRAVNEGTSNYEYLEHGEISGYVLKKEDYKGQENNSGTYSVGTETMSYNDYSNVGRLYFGGGFGKLSVEFYKYSNNTYSYTNKDTTTINGKVKFNGEFKGELDFQNFKYECKYESGNGYEYKLISGSVKIGSLDVTEKYLDFVIKGNSPEPDREIDQRLVGVWAEDADVDIDGYAWMLSFDSDGTGVEFYSEGGGWEEWEFDWYVQNGRLYISEYGWCEYEIDGETLTLEVRSWGETIVMFRHNGELPRGAKSTASKSLRAKTKTRK